MKRENEVNDEYLRNLDKNNKDGQYPLIVITDAFGMRGFDYRGNDKGLTLIIVAPFKNYRNML